jgi:hypothetical protein
MPKTEESQSICEINLNQHNLQPQTNPQKKKILTSSNPNLELAKPHINQSCIPLSWMPKTEELQSICEINL